MLFVFLLHAMVVRKVPERPSYPTDTRVTRVPERLSTPRDTTLSERPSNPMDTRDRQSLMDTRVPERPDLKDSMTLTEAHEKYQRRINKEVHEQVLPSLIDKFQSQATREKVAELVTSRFSEFDKDYATDIAMRLQQDYHLPSNINYKDSPLPIQRELSSLPQSTLVELIRLLLLFNLFICHICQHTLCQCFIVKLQLLKSLSASVVERYLVLIHS